MDPATAIADGIVDVDGDPGLLEDFVSIFTVPYGVAAGTDTH
ncbi:hypothetical protein [Salana multivorans]